MLQEITGVTNQTFPLLIVLHLLEIFPPKIPSEALATKGMGAEVTQINLASFRTPPKNIIIMHKDIEYKACGNQPAKLIISLLILIPASFSVLTFALAAH